MPHSIGDLPRSGIESMFPTLAGGFFVTEPPGKPWEIFSLSRIKKGVPVTERWCARLQEMDPIEKFETYLASLSRVSLGGRVYFVEPQEI